MPDLQPGPEMDALICERVMEWKKDECQIERGDCPPYVHYPGDPAEHFSPSVDISAAWEVVEKMGSDVFQVERDVTSPPNMRWEAGFEEVREDPQSREMVYAHADTAPHAICLAALKAVGQ